MVQLGEDHATLAEPGHLMHPGEYVLVSPGTFVRYSSEDASSTLLVLGEQSHSRGHAE